MVLVDRIIKEKGIKNIMEKEKDMLNLQPYGGEVDLNNPKTYQHYEWKNYSVEKLHEVALAKLGYVFLYLHYWHPTVEFGEQKEEVEKYFESFVIRYAEGRTSHFQETEENAMWLKKFIYRLLNETENMC